MYGISTSHESSREAHSTTLLYIQDLVVAGVVRLRTAPRKDNVADLQMKVLPVFRLRYLCELYHPRPTVVYYNAHAIIHHNHHVNSTLR